jgi:hypothetical protein
MQSRDELELDLGPCRRRLRLPISSLGNVRIGNGRLLEAPGGPPSLLTTTRQSSTSRTVSQSYNSMLENA